MRRRSLVLIFLLSTLSAAPMAAQIPDEFTNLQLLGEEIEKQRLIGIMRTWAGALGVRCTHCHVGPDNLVGMDFATDEKETKKTARRMLQMARAINRELLADLPTVAEGERHQVVSCYTCHRGMNVPPKNIRVQLGATLMGGGIDQVITEYKELRQEHYGAGRYDFSARGVFAMGQQLMEMNRAPDAVKMFETGLEFFPEAPNLHAGLGMALAGAGDADAAAAAFDKALEIDPSNQMAQAGLRRVKAANP